MNPINTAFLPNDDDTIAAALADAHRLIVDIKDNDQPQLKPRAVPGDIESSRRILELIGNVDDANSFASRNENRVLKGFRIQLWLVLKDIQTAIEQYDRETAAA